MSPTESTVFRRAQRTVLAVHDLLVVRGDAPPHIHRGYCVDCEAAVELARDHRCYCGSRSVVPSRGRAVA